MNNAGERDQILTDVVALMKLAVDYAYPELGFITTDSVTCGHKCFSRSSSIS